MITEFPSMDSIAPDRSRGVGKKGDIIAVYDDIPSLVFATREAQRKCPKAFQYTDNRDGGWNGDGWNNTLERLTNGHLPSVADSDKLMSKLEDMTGFETRAFQTVNDVVGGAPNIGNFLAGNPLSMRRRMRVESEQSPLTILVDLTASSSCPAEQLVRRGAAVLALTRVLAAKRPINLYVGASLYIDANEPSGRSSSSFMVRIDTAPLDLARAAYILNAPSILRRIAFGLLTAQDCGNNGHGSLPFAYGNPDGYRARIHAYWARIVAVGEALAIPPLHGNDEFRDPVQWVKDMVAKYGANNNP